MITVTTMAAMVSTDTGYTMAPLTLEVSFTAFSM